MERFFVYETPGQTRPIAVLYKPRIADKYGKACDELHIGGYTTDMEKIDTARIVLTGCRSEGKIKGKDMTITRSFTQKNKVRYVARGITRSAFLAGLDELRRSGAVVSNVKSIGRIMR